MLQEQCRQELKAVVDAYAKATNRSISAISEQFYGKSNIFDKFIAGGCTMTIKRFDKVMTDLRICWPKGEPWPGTGPKAGNISGKTR